MHRLHKAHTRFLAVSMGLLLIISASAITQVAHAASGEVYFSPASQSVQAGATVSVQLRVNPGTSIDSVEATASYDTSKLTYVSIDSSSSAFSDQLAQTVNTATGSINFQRGVGVSSPDVSGDALIAVITFKAIASSGSSTLSLSGTDGYNSGAKVTFTQGNATVGFSAATCPSGQTGTPPNCVTPTANTSSGTSGSSGTTKTTTTPTTGPTKTTTPSTGNTTTPAVTTPTTPATPITTMQDVQFSSASITATTQTPTQVYVEYGTSKNALTYKTALSASATSHTISLDSSLLVPGQTYYYEVVSQDSSGAITQGTTQTLTTKGLTVSVGVFDASHMPIANKQVTLHSIPYVATTNGQGIATFANVTPGAHHVTYVVGKKTYSQALAVANNITTAADGTQTSAPQNISVVYNLSQKSGINWLLLLVGVVILVVTALALFRFLNKRSRGHLPIAPATTTTSVGDVVPTATIAPSLQSPVIQSMPAQPVSPEPVSEQFVVPASIAIPVTAAVTPMPVPVTTPQPNTAIAAPSAPGTIITPVQPVDTTEGKSV